MFFDENSYIQVARLSAFSACLARARNFKDLVGIDACRNGNFYSIISLNPAFSPTDIAWLAGPVALPAAFRAGSIARYNAEDSFVNLLDFACSPAGKAFINGSPRLRSLALASGAKNLLI